MTNQYLQSKNLQQLVAVDKKANPLSLSGRAAGEGIRENSTSISRQVIPQVSGFISES
jgi:hypothetical protein